jgi:hypothetical protein
LDRQNSAGTTAMTNSRLHAAIALGSALVIAAFVAFLPSVPPASAKSQAQRVCREEGISASSEVHEICLSQTIGALERGEYWLVRGFARVGVDAQEACLRSGIQPQTDSFRACIDRESYGRGLLVPR